MTNCVTIATAAGIRQRTPTDSKASSKDRLTVVTDSLGLPDKEEVRGSSPLRPTVQSSFSVGASGRGAKQGASRKLFDVQGEAPLRTR